MLIFLKVGAEFPSLNEVLRQTQLTKDMMFVINSSPNFSVTKIDAPIESIVLQFSIIIIASASTQTFLGRLTTPTAARAG